MRKNFMILSSNKRKHRSINIKFLLLKKEIQTSGSSTSEEHQLQPRSTSRPVMTFTSLALRPTGSSRHWLILAHSGPPRSAIEAAVMSQ